MKPKELQIMKEPVRRPEWGAAQVIAGLAGEAAFVEDWLRSSPWEKDVPQGLKSAMEYSLLGGGKRIRPVLCLLSARLHGLEREAVLPFACALECIHTYSLIHDDLPAMDNDDLRRGKPSNHKMFDEATAVLAGDGLLSDAFAFMASVAKNGIPALRVLQAISLVASAIGSPGMVGGQFLDMRYTRARDIRLKQLTGMYAMKTGALLRAACEAGAVLAGAGSRSVRAMRAYGSSLGSAFQIIDDILDEVGTEANLGKPIGSDAARGKTTYVSLLGLEEARALAARLAEEAANCLRGYDGDEAALLRGLAGYIIIREA